MRPTYWILGLATLSIVIGLFMSRDPERAERLNQMYRDAALTGETRQMVELLVRLKSSTTMLLIEHDMDAVFRLADRVCVLVAGRSVCIGTTAEVRNDPRATSAYLDAEQGHA